MAAAAWGFAEATIFFVVPDVLLTSIALSSLKRAAIASLFASLGAAAGAILLCVFAAHHPLSTFNILLHVPGVSQTTLQTVGQYLQAGTFTGMLYGAFTGVPFKAFVAVSGRYGTDPAYLALLTPLVRLPRFLALSAVAWILSELVGNRLTQRAKLITALSLWTVFYVIYFQVVGW